jgi:formate dehydrogenase maturation protein FdhE
MNRGKWDARLGRANELAAKHPFAEEALQFYTHVVQFQKSVCADFEREAGTENVFRDLGTLRQELDLFLLLPRFAPFLSIVEQHAPAALAESARTLRTSGTPAWQRALVGFWQGESGVSGAEASAPEPEKLPQPEQSPGAQALLAWMFLQPYAEYLAEHANHPLFTGTPRICPLCGSKPQVGALRPEGDGGKRTLLCSLCATEWDFRRIVCAACGEEDVDKLAVYTAEEFKHVRVEACDTCRRYIKTVDLTKNGNAIPVVDELATIPLNLWAAEHGYEKVEKNILGI